MDWWQAIFGLLFVVVSVPFAFGIRKPMHVTSTDMHGHERSEFRMLTTGEQLGLGAMVTGFAVVGALMLVGAIPWTDARLPEESLLGVLGVGAVALVGGVLAFALLKVAFEARQPAKASSASLGGGEESPGADEVVMALIWRALLAHPIGAALLGVVFAYLAVFATTQLPAAWRGDWDELAAVLAWFQPISALGDLVGLGEVTVSLILLALWIVIALFTGNELSAALTIVMFVLFWVVALVCWPFGAHNEWLGWGRDLLSLL